MWRMHRWTKAGRRKPAENLGRARGARRILRHNTATWRGVVSRRRQRRIEEIAFDTMVLLGYRPELARAARPSCVTASSSWSTPAIPRSRTGSDCRAISCGCWTRPASSSPATTRSSPSAPPSSRPRTSGRPAADVRPPTSVGGRTLDLTAGQPVAPAWTLDRLIPATAAGDDPLSGDRPRRLVSSLVTSPATPRFSKRLSWWPSARTIPKSSVS